MPVGYWLTVAVTSWGVACALTRWRRPGSFSAIPALLVSGLPLIVAYLLIASTVIASIRSAAVSEAVEQFTAKVR